MAKRKTLAEQYLEAKEKLEEQEEKTLEKGNVIDTIERLKEEIEKYDRNEPTDFSNVKWSVLVKDKDFTEDMMLRFQVMAQNYYKDFVENHKVSDNFIRKMYYEFLGVFSLSWLSEKDRKRIFFLKYSKDKVV